MSGEDRDVVAEEDRSLEAQWWAINGAELMAALTRAHAGDDPGLVYLELLANSNRED